MLRASSEMTVASSVASADENPTCRASSRPFCRAGRMSPLEAISMVASLSRTPTDESDSAATHGGSNNPTRVRLPGALFPARYGNAYSKSNRLSAFEPDPQLRHRKGHLRLNAHHNRFGAAQTDHLSEILQGAARKRVQHVERGDIDDHSARPRASHLLHQRLAQG